MCVLRQIAVHGETDFKWSQVVDWEQHKEFGGQEGAGGEGQEEEIFIVCLLLTVSLIAQFLPNYFAVTEGCYNQGFWNFWVLHSAVKTKLISSPLPHVPHSESWWDLGHRYKDCFIVSHAPWSTYQLVICTHQPDKNILSSRIQTKLPNTIVLSAH
jgi:hypothetical protein